MRWGAVVGAVLVGGLLSAVSASAAGGRAPRNLDPSFGHAGIVDIESTLPAGLIPVRGAFSEVRGAPDGSTYYSVDVRRCEKAETGGDKTRPCEKVVTAVVRLNPNGSLDRGFATGGALIFEKGEIPSVIGVDAAGRLLTLTGYEGDKLHGVRVSRFLTSGRRDPGFGGDGQVVLRGIEYADTLVPGPGGRILVGTEVSGTEDGEEEPWYQQIRLEMLLPDGRLDARFARHGVGTYLLPGASQYPPLVTVAAGGAIYVAGELCCETLLTQVSRISAQGKLDTEWDARSRASQLHFERRFRSPEVTAILPRANGEVDLYGETEGSYEKSARGFAIRLHRSGAIDKSFGRGGMRRLPHAVIAAAPGQGGAGFAVLPDEVGLSVVRLGGDGEPDKSFGGVTGRRLPVVGSGASLEPLASGGAILYSNGASGAGKGVPAFPFAARIAEPASRARPLIAAHASAAPAGLDPGFGKKGVALLELPPSSVGNQYVQVSQFAASASGSTFGISPGNNCVSSSCGQGVSVFRIDATGRLDEAFGGSGFVAIAGGAQARVLAADAQGRPLVATLRKGSVTVARYTAEGALDTSFGTAGSVRLPCNCGPASISLIVEGDGGVLVAVEAPGDARGGGSGRVRLTRLQPSGALDQAFGHGGSTSVDLAGRRLPGSIAVDPAGSVYIGSVSCCASRPYLLRVTAAGRLDRGFVRTAAKSLRRLASLGEFSELKALLPQSDGTVELVGLTQIERGFALELRRDGRLARFGRKGLVRLPFAVEAASLGADDAVFAVGYRKGARGYRAFRVLADGRLDPRFGSDGRRIPLFGSGLAVTSLGDGRAVVTDLGYEECRSGCPAEPGIARFLEGTG